MLNFKPHTHFFQTSHTVQTLYSAALKDIAIPDRLLKAGEVIAHELAYHFYPASPDEKLTIYNPDTHCESYNAQMITSGEEGLIPILITPASKSSNGIHLTFRGTKRDTSIKRAMDPKGAGSYSFYKAADTIIQQLLAAIEKHYHLSGKKIILSFSGHSLGSADAQNCLAALLKKLTLEEDWAHEKIKEIRFFGYQSAGIPKKAAEKATQYLNQLILENRVPKIKCYWYHFEGDPIQQQGETNLFADCPPGVEVHLFKIFIDEKLSQANLSAHRSKTFKPETTLRLIEYYTTLANEHETIKEKLTNKSAALFRAQYIVWYFSYLARLGSPYPRRPFGHSLKLAFEALQILDESSSAVECNPHPPLLQAYQLYNPEDAYYQNIIQVARSLLKKDEHGKVHPGNILRFLNGDTSESLDHLHTEIKENICQLLDKRPIVTDIPNLMTAAENQILHLDSKDIQFFYFAFENNALTIIPHPTVRQFLLDNNIDVITIVAINAILAQLTQLTLELVCNPKNNRLQEWLADPETFGFETLYQTPRQQKEVMPLIFNAVLSILCPIAVKQHKDYFENLMTLIVFFVQKGILPIKNELIDTYIHMHKESSLSPLQKRSCLFQERRMSLDNEEEKEYSPQLERIATFSA